MAQELRVDGNTFIPEGAEDISYLPIYVDDEFVDTTSSAELFYNDDTTAPEGDGPPIPETFNIISYTIRVNSDGTQVVDVVCETDDFPGVQEVEVRVTVE